MAASLAGAFKPPIYTVRATNGSHHPIPGAEWADWDHRGRLLFARGGKLFAVEPGQTGLNGARELIDLNGNKFEPVVAPEWAKTW
jgi:hypothetical protein